MSRTTNKGPTWTVALTEDEVRTIKESLRFSRAKIESHDYGRGFTYDEANRLRQERLDALQAVHDALAARRK